MSSETVVLITGANSGIGYQTVQALIETSTEYHIFLGARSSEKSSEAIKKLEEEVPDTISKITSVVIDIDSDESIEKLYEEVKAKVDHIDVLINNAGKSLPLTSFIKLIYYARGGARRDRP